MEEGWDNNQQKKKEIKHRPWVIREREYKKLRREI